MGHTPAPDATLSPQALAARREKLFGEIRAILKRRAAAHKEPDTWKRIELTHGCNQDIRDLVNEAYNELGIPKTELHVKFRMSRQGLHNIMTGRCV